MIYKNIISIYNIYTYIKEKSVIYKYITLKKRKKRAGKNTIKQSNKNCLQYFFKDNLLSISYLQRYFYF